MPKANMPSFKEPSIVDGFFSLAWMRYMHELFQRVGGDKGYSLGGTLTVDTTSVGNVGGGEDTLITYAMEKNILNNAGDSVVIEAFGTFADNANNKTLKLILGSTTLFSTGAVAFRNQDWCLRSTVIRTGAATQKCITTLYTDYADITNIVDYVAGTENFATSLTIKCTGTGTSDNDIVQQGLIIKQYPR